MLLDNSVRPLKPNLSEVDTAEMKQFLELITLLLSSIGIDILEDKTIMPQTEKKREKDLTYI